MFLYRVDPDFAVHRMDGGIGLSNGIGFSPEDATIYHTDTRAKKVYAFTTHGILSGPAIQVINESGLEKLVVTNTIPLAEKQAQCDKLEVVDISQLLAETIRRSHFGESVVSLLG